MVIILVKRIIPCLDVKDGKVVKGVNFEKLKDVGDPVSLGVMYNDQDADELVFLDITATNDKRQIVVDLVKRIAEQVFIPFTIGGGLQTIDDIKAVLRSGADKVSLNTAAVQNPRLVRHAAQKFGSQCIVIAIDVKYNGYSWEVYTHSGTKNTGLDALEWAKQVVELGAGELLVTSIDRDGTKAGFDIELYKSIGSVVNVPIIASGGAGTLESILEILRVKSVDAALAASIFHYSEYSVADIKRYLQDMGVDMRK